MSLLRPMLAAVFALLFANVSPTWAVTDCDKAMSLFTRAKFASDRHRIALYQESIDLCPGYIRPYELAGNWYRKKGFNKQATELFGKAAELGSTNNKYSPGLGIFKGITPKCCLNTDLYPSKTKYIYKIKIKKYRRIY